MYTDMFGNRRLKINLHTHTTNSDGAKTPNEAAEIYKSQGYDIIAISDHRIYTESQVISGLRIIGGAEYNIDVVTSDGGVGVFHILMTGGERAPKIDSPSSVQEIIDEIIAAGGIATLAHPAWSLNTLEQARDLKGIVATEIYNSVSDAHESSRPYSGYFVDTAAARGFFYSLIATDDTHYYDGSDDTKSYIMLEGDISLSDKEITDRIARGLFYATQGPEIHLRREGDEAVVYCSPAVRISFFSSKPWSKGRCFRGENLTEARTAIKPGEKFIRAEITDKDGNLAWSNCLVL